MNNQIQYKYGSTSLFRTAKCVNVPVGDFIDVPEAPQNAVSIDGNAGLVQCPEILMVTSGAFELQAPELPQPISIMAGEIGSPQRYKSRLKIVATQPSSAYTCIIPWDNSFWERESGFVASGQQTTIQTSEGATQDFVLVTIGGLRIDENEYLVGALVPVQNGSVLTGIGNSYFVHMWKPAP